MERVDKNMMVHWPKRIVFSATPPRVSGLHVQQPPIASAFKREITLVSLSLSRPIDPLTWEALPSQSTISTWLPVYGEG
jgi:hypothetical protein